MPKPVKRSSLDEADYIRNDQRCIVLSLSSVMQWMLNGTTHSEMPNFGVQLHTNWCSDRRIKPTLLCRSDACLTYSELVAGGKMKGVSRTLLSLFPAIRVFPGESQRMRGGIVDCVAPNNRGCIFSLAPSATHECAFGHWRKETKY
jgi:hypothetical protein